MARSEVIKVSQPPKRLTFPTPELQRDLFEISDGSSPAQRAYSNVLALWDLLPKYDVFGTTKRYHTDLAKEEQIRIIPVRQRIYQESLTNGDEAYIELELQITPALIEKKRVEWIDDPNGTSRRKRKRVYARDENGNYITDLVYVYPGLREDKVEEALKMLLAHGQGEFESERTGVKFSIKQLQKELAKNGSALSVDEIKESLTILSRARCEIYGLDSNGKRKSVIGSNFLPNLGMIDRNTYEARLQANEDTFCYTQFHMLVTIGIRDNMFRLTNYAKHQRLDNLLSRFIHKVLRISFTNASTTGRPYRLSMNQTLEEFGRLATRRDNDRLVLITALNDLQRENIIASYEEEEPIKDPRDQRIILDRYFQLYPSDDFIDEMIKANARAKQNKALLDEFVDVKTTATRVAQLEGEDKEIFQGLRALDIPAGVALKLLEDYDHREIRAALRETSKKAAASQIDNPRGFLIAALREHYYAAELEVIEKGPETSELQPDPIKLDALTKKLRDFVLLNWSSWSQGEKATFNTVGLASGHFQIMLEEAGLSGAA